MISDIQPINTDGDVAEMNDFGFNSISIEDYSRYHIDSEILDDLQSIPRRFDVKVGKFGLAKLLMKEFFHYFGKWDVVFSRPCTYGVFSGPVGGFSPRPELCVGCLRCTIQHPEFVDVTHNPEYLNLGDNYTTFKHISTIDEEAKKGNVPVRGQGYRGKFGGPGFDGMLTDMSEIVRPSRDGIHGREIIGTSVDLGSKPMNLKFSNAGSILGELPNMVTIQVPFVFDTLPCVQDNPLITQIIAKTAEEIDTLAFIQAEQIVEAGLSGRNIVPVLDPGNLDCLELLGGDNHLLELSSWDLDAYTLLKGGNSNVLVAVVLEFNEGWMDEFKKMISAGVEIFHLKSDLHGRGSDGTFIMDSMKEAHMHLVETGVRDKISLIGSGGISAADHLPKAIICGADAVSIDIPLMFALQGRSMGSLSSRADTKFTFSRKLSEKWGVQRLKNLSASWRDQMLEILGAMGIREVRRLRGEFGRSMIVSDLEHEAFGEIEGYVKEGSK